jgi:hypothetical protein
VDYQVMTYEQHIATMMAHPFDRDNMIHVYRYTDENGRCKHCLERLYGGRHEGCEYRIDHNIPWADLRQGRHR